MAAQSDGTHPGGGGSVRLMSAVGVVLAGGTGTRIGGEVPKQLLELAGRPILVHAVAAFQAAPEIDEIVVMMAPAYVEAVEALLAAQRFDKVTRVLAGGDTRSESTRLALAALGDTDRDVLLHDAARPLVTPGLIGDCARALATAEAVTAGVTSTDTVATIVKRGSSVVITGVGDRAAIRRVQTPQGFRLATIRRAYALADTDPGFVATDDTSVVVRYLPEVAVHIVEGDEANIKVTTPADLALAEMLLTARKSSR
jgi:ribitol-5-phosphate 2-dehydrogenase (NADP+) / D-ribitol-5-phosphate cytidylyltransferase